MLLPGKDEAKPHVLLDDEALPIEISIKLSVFMA
jgi:hypothetical protein